MVLWMTENDLINLGNRVIDKQGNIVYFNDSLIEGANSPTLNVKNVLESGRYYCLVTSIINGEEISVRTETIIVDIAAIKVAIPTINNDTYTYTHSDVLQRRY